jgi:chaperonin GroES
MIKPLPNYVLIEPADQEETTVSGLVLPDKVKEKPAKGKIIAKGNYMESKDYNLVLWDMIKEGQNVVFNRWSGTTIKDGEKEYLLVRFTDLQGIYE